ncbi:hypothetical protein GCM10027443_43790 [Pontibacter brevis]
MGQNTRWQTAKPVGAATSQKTNLQQAEPQSRSSNSPAAQFRKAAPKPLTTANTPVYWPDRVFVKLKEQASSQIQPFDSKASRPKTINSKISGALQRFDASSVAKLPVNSKLSSTRNLYEVVVEKPENLQSLLVELNNMPEVAYAERVPYYVTTQAPNDPYYTGNNQYAINLTKAADAFRIQTGTNKTLLAIIDDAVMISHPDLAANIDVAKSYDVADKDDDPNPPTTGANAAAPGVFSHGTHCAGIAGAVTNNNMGVAAVSNNNISIMGVKCTSDAASSTRAIERAYEGVIYAINQGARVLSLSWGGSGSSVTLHNLFNEAAANGIVVVAAAGNSANEAMVYPAAFNNVIAVASSDNNDLASSFTSYGTWVDVTAPGSAIMSTVAGGTTGSYALGWGTSMAAPMVAGMVAHMLSENPTLTPQAVLHILKSSADPIDNAPGQDPKYAGKLGAGRINLYQATRIIQGITNTVAPSAITDLKTSNTTETTVRLSWTSPGVNGTEAATLYDVRYATAPITTANFSSATRTTASVVPAQPGTAQELVVKNLTPGTFYYFAIMARSFYGDGTLSNIVSSRTLDAPKVDLDRSTLTFNIDRDASATATQNFNLNNIGNGPLRYTATVIPTSGKNVLSYDNGEPDAENSLGLSGGGFYAAVKFIAGPRGFYLTHVQNHINGNIAATANVPIGIRIFKGGTSPGNATLVTSQTTLSSVEAEGSLLTFQLHEPQHFLPGDVFWVDFSLPEELRAPQAFDNTGPRSGTFFVSSDGTHYDDVQSLAAFLDIAAFRIRATCSDGLTISPASGTVAPAQSQLFALSVDAEKLVNETFKANVQIKSNDPLEPVANKPLIITITGGQPTMVVDNTTVDFGTLYAHSSVTKSVLIKNTGVANLDINTASFDGGAFPASDFVLSPAAPILIKPGEQQVVSITFKPSRVDALAGTLTLSSNAPDAPAVTLHLMATAIAPPVAVTPVTLHVTIDKEEATTATEVVKIKNDGNSTLNYTLQIQPETPQTLKYDPDRVADDFIGRNSTTAVFWTAMKFTVTTPSFTLLQVQNYYRTQFATDPNIVMRVYKGGTSPTNGTLLSQQNLAPDANTRDGAFASIPLQQPHSFVLNDVFWVVFIYNGVPYAQGYNSGSPGTNVNLYSINGTSWTSYNTNTFKIRALGIPAWIATAPASGALAAGEEAEFTVQLDAAYLNVGSHKAKVLVKTDKAGYPEYAVDVNLRVRDLPVADFTTAYTNVVTGRSIKFINTSTNADAYEWEFEGAKTVTSTEESPTAQYTTPGVYKVILTAKKSNGTATAPLVREGYVVVADNHCEELNAPFAGTPTTYKSGDGFVTGNNTYGDLAKANMFTYDREGNSYLTGVKIRFGYADTTASDTATVKIAVWRVADGVPGEIIASRSIKISDIAADVAAQRATEVIFGAAVPVAGDFMAGVVLNYEANSQVAIATHTVTEKPAAGVQGWEQLQDGSWDTVLAGWGADLAMFIQPAISRKLEPLVAAFHFADPVVNFSAATCAGTEMLLDASQTKGATRVEWVYEGADVARADGQNTYLAYNEPGTYTITLNAYDDCNGVVSVSKTVTVFALPVATITASGTTTFCEGGSVILSASEGAGYLWSNGETTRTVTVTEAGNYTVTVTSESGCEATSAATTVLVHELPTAAIMTSGDTTFCEGGNVMLTASEGTSYRWSNGETTQAINITASGNYTVTVRNAAGCEATSEAVTVTANPLPGSTLTASGDTTFCQGGSVTLTAEEGASYLWSNGATTRSVSVTSGGNYSVQITTAAGCSITSDAITITVNPLPTATITATGATTFCAGGSVVLTASEGSSYLWSNGETTRSVTVANSGNYTVAITNTSGCQSISAATPVTVIEIPAKPVITQHVRLLTSSAAEGNQWFLNGTAIKDATTQTYTVRRNGTYTLQVTSNGCTSPVSDELIVTAETTAGIKAMEVYPNPASEAFTLSFSMAKEESVGIRVISSTGQLVMEEVVPAFKGTYEKQISLPGAASGTYILQILYSDKVATRKVVLNR